MFLSEIISYLDRKVISQEDLHEYCKTLKFNDFAKSTEFKEMLDAQRHIVFQQWSNSPNYARILESQGGFKFVGGKNWSIYFSKKEKTFDHVYSMGAPLALVNLSDEPGMVTQYEISDIAMADPIQANACSLDAGRSITIMPGEAWAPSSRDALIRVHRPDPTAIWLTIEAPVDSVYFHAFDCNNSAYLFSALSEISSLSRHFSCQIVRSFCYEYENSDKKSPEVDRLIVGMSRFLSDDANTTDESAWMLAQGLGRVSPENCVDLLSKLAESKSSVGGLARSYLS